MKTVNALKIRNNLGEILDLLEKTKEPILVSKGRRSGRSSSRRSSFRTGLSIIRPGKETAASRHDQGLQGKERG